MAMARVRLTSATAFATTATSTTAPVLRDRFTSSGHKAALAGQAHSGPATSPLVREPGVGTYRTLSPAMLVRALTRTL